MLLRQGIGRWLFLLPTVAFFVGYQVWPIFRVLWLSFTDYQFLTTDKPENWVWFDNYIQALSDPLMWSSLWRATLFTIMFLPGTIIDQPIPRNGSSHRPVRPHKQQRKGLERVGRPRCTSRPRVGPCLDTKNAEETAGTAMLHACGDRSLP
jgi:hypothetical protein